MARVSTATRKRTATIVQKSGSGKKYRFPMPDKEHARLALQDLPKAHGLTPSNKTAIRARARRILGHVTPSMRSSAGAFDAARRIMSRRGK